MKKAKSKRAVVLTLLGVLALVIIAGILVAVGLNKQREQREERERTVNAAINVGGFYEGVSVQGIDFSGKSLKKGKKLAAKVEEDTRPNIKITVKADGKTYTLKKGDFAFKYDTEAVVKAAYNYGRIGSAEERYEKVTALKQSGKDFSITATLKKGSIKKAVEKIADKVDVDAVEPRVTDFSGDDVFVVADGKNGQALDRDDLYKKLTKLLDTKTKGSVKAVVKTVKFKDTAAGIKRRAKIIGSFSTTSVNNSAANANMRRALESANGIRLEPGEVFSFNATTGNTTNGSNGYQKAGAISGGKLIEEYGGGICQASTTIYGAALRADMEIIERHNHTWPSVYVSIGQDASINYPTSDFKFRNSKNYPVFISAGMSGTRLTVEIIGDGDDDYDYIDVVSEKTESIPRGKAIEQVDPSLSKGARKTEREGRDGARARAWRVYYKNGKEIKRKEISASYYPPVTEIVKVGK